MAFESLVPWRRNTSITSDPFDQLTSSPLTSLQREMNRMFNNMWSMPGAMTRGTSEDGRAFFYPDVELSETNGEIEVSAELPGVSEKDIDVTLAQDGKHITIKGEKKLEKEKREKDFYCAERSYGAFRRTLGLPSAVDQDKVTAEFRNGVLNIKLTKIDESSQGVKHIDIKAT